MAKGKKSVGLPGDFKINVDKPVDLGDYLDETTEASKTVQLRRQAKKPVEPVVELSEEPIEQEAQTEPKKSTPEVVRLRSKQEAKTGDRPKKRKPVKRKQINMSPKTLERFAELVNYVQEYSQQSDAAASEVMDAIISAHYDAMSRLRLGSVPPRGRWGSPTAQAFKDALSRAFTDALIDYHSERSSEQRSSG